VKRLMSYDRCLEAKGENNNTPNKPSPHLGFCFPSLSKLVMYQIIFRSPPLTLTAFPLMVQRKASIHH